MNSSPLKSLPLELRLDIYERVLHVEGGVTVTLNKPRTKTSGNKSLNPKELASSSKQKNLLAISATCKAIARETAGIIFSINDTWTFTSPDDDSTAWGKRVREWSATADQKNNLHRAKNVRFNLGFRVSRRSNFHQFKPMDIPNEAAALFLNLPRILRQPTITHTIKLALDWTDGVSLGHKRTERLRPCVYYIPIFGTPKKIRKALYGPTRRQTRTLDLDSRLRKVWLKGTDSHPPGTYPPIYPVQYERVSGDSVAATMAMLHIEDAMREYADVIGKQLFEKSEHLDW